MSDYQFLKFTLKDKIAFLSLNRPDKANALNESLWLEIPKCFKWTDQESAVRVVVLKGEGKHFCAGIDLEALAGLTQGLPEDPGRKSESLKNKILKFEEHGSKLPRFFDPQGKGLFPFVR